MEFLGQKELRLAKDDMSRKGSVDSQIRDLIAFINNQDCYVTTSSCSGRIVVFENSELKKKGCRWIFVSHDVVSAENVIDALKSHDGSATLKFEPFVLHVQCSTIEDAQKIHTVSIESGFRNSGLSISKKGKIIAAVRSTLSLEAPLSAEGSLLVSHEYISHVVNICNEKMKENLQRIDRLFLGLKKSFVQRNRISENDQILKSKVNCKKHGSSSKKPVKEDCESSDIYCDGFQFLLKN